jgi:hypothetical protein
MDISISRLTASSMKIRLWMLLFIVDLDLSLFFQLVNAIGLYRAEFNENSAGCRALFVQ